MRCAIWLLAICLVTPVQALDLFAASDGQERFLTREPADPRATQDIDEGEAGADTVRWDLRLSPVRNATWEIDGTIAASIRIGAAAGIGSVDLSATLRAGNVTLAMMPAKSVTYASDFVTTTWQSPIQRNLSLQDGPLWWNITAQGTFSAVFLDMAGDDRSRVSIPVNSMTIPLPPIATEHHNVSADRLRVKWHAEQPLRRLVTYDWEAPSNITGQIDVVADNGTATAAVTVAAGTLWAGAWPPSGNDTLAWNNLTGPVRLTLRFEAFQGSLDLLMEPVLPEEPEKPPKKPSSAPAFLGLAIILWLAARKG